MNKTSKTYKDILPYADNILSGKVLAIDPSTGSGSSLPGYAMFDNGILTECGVIEVEIGSNKNYRLSEINRTLREEFPSPDVLLVEYIPPVKYGKGGMNSIALMGLHYSVGAVMAAFPNSHLIEIATRFWMHNHKWDKYKKGDMEDAVAIGMAVINTAEYIKSLDNK